MASYKQQASRLEKQISNMDVPNKEAILEALREPSKESINLAKQFIDDNATEKPSGESQEETCYPESTGIAELVRDDDPDFKSYIQHRMTEGTLEKSPLELPPLQQESLLRAFAKWKAAGSPSPRLPDTLTDSGRLVIDKIYREKFYGKQYLWYITDDCKHHGREMIPEYAKDADGSDDTDFVIAKHKKLTIPFTKEKASELMETAFETSYQPKFYIVEGPVKGAVRNPQKNFLADFDEIIEKVKTGKTV